MCPEDGKAKEAHVVIKEIMEECSKAEDFDKKLAICSLDEMQPKFEHNNRTAAGCFFSLIG